MRACLESDKKQAIETLSKTFEQEKLKCIEETKKKQWVCIHYIKVKLHKYQFIPIFVPYKFMILLENNFNYCD